MLCLALVVLRSVHPDRPLSLFFGVIPQVTLCTSAANATSTAAESPLCDLLPRMATADQVLCP